MSVEQEAPNAMALAWADRARRPWVVVGTASTLFILLLIFGGLSGRLTVPPPRAVATPPAAQPAQPVEQTQPAQPAPEQPAPAQPAPAGPGGETGEQAQPAQPAQPVQPARPAFPNLGVRFKLPPVANEMALAALPLLLGLFWLLSAWLVDSEARRAFVIQEPWGERRTMAYSCLAVGCVFPLILAGLIFAAWGFVQFVIYVANRQSWSAGIQSGGLILLVCACFLLLRSAIVRWQTERRSKQF